jgi:poly(hydroxyalkanoate) depolymerase family esterase
MAAPERKIAIALPHRRRLVRLLAVVVALVVATMVTNLPERHAAAAPGQLTEVTGFGSNPGNLQMYEWIPTDLPPDAPVIVMLHGCFSNAGAYDTETGLGMLADRWNVALVLPQQRITNNLSSCFNSWEAGDNTRGEGEALSVKQMVDWMHANRGTDPDRVYVMGHSGGGFFTSVLLATYPDVFKAGAIVAGAPYKCGADMTECGGGSANKTPQEWGDLARSGFPGYTGSKPPVSIWHGSADTTVNPANLTELVEQWTDYHGIDQVVDVDELVKGYPHKVYENAAGAALVESYSITGKGHGWPIDPGANLDQCDGGTPPSADYDICAAYHIGQWFGLGASEARQRPGAARACTPHAGGRQAGVIQDARPVCP